MNRIWRLILIYWPWRYPLRSPAFVYDTDLGAMGFKAEYQVDETKSYRERVQFRKWWYEAHDLMRSELRDARNDAIVMDPRATVIESKFEDTQRSPLNKGVSLGEFPTTINDKA